MRNLNCIVGMLLRCSINLYNYHAYNFRQCLLAADVFYISTQIRCTMSSFTNVSLPDCYTDQLYNPDDYLAGFYLYLILSLILTVGNAILRTVLPALAGDQVRYIRIR